MKEGAPTAASAAAVGNNRLPWQPRLSGRAEVLETVDLAAEEGFLWQPISMSVPECTADDLDCDATVRYCLIHMGEYQENPWKYPMSAMLQKKSACLKSENARAYRLSTLRVSRTVSTC